jgi:hypothetical protein
MTVRVVQWATGAVGSAQLQEIIDRPDLELAGVFVYSEDKVGVDAGRLVGRPNTGVTATNSAADIFSLDADLVLHTASKAFPVNTNTDDIVALLGSGKSVITTTSYNHLPTFDPDVAARIAAACEKGGSRFHAAGEHPGFMLERLATTITALSQGVERITIQEFVDCSGVPSRVMLVDLMGMGKPPDQISPQSPMFRAIAVQYRQALAAAADVIGLTIDEIRSDIRTATSDRDVPVACGLLPAGTVVGQILEWSAYHNGSAALTVQEIWTCTNEIPDWAAPDNGQFLVRVTVDGTPPLRLELSIDNAPVPGLPHSSTGQLAVAMTAVRAIPYVLQAPPGVVTAPVFGAYQWPS